ncbi:MAG: SDR family oxidoreductase [Pseudorhodobacter sp.]|nr:SDR family oxidoreductase [Pseudorhodobacter sp.]
MDVLIIGAAGMLGRKLAQALTAQGSLGEVAITRLVLADVTVPPRPAGFGGTVTLEAVDLAQPGVAARLVADRPGVIFHLAAVVSGEAEVDFAKGYAVNLDATRALFEAIRVQNVACGYRPRLVFASSIAVFGAPFPEVINDDYFTTPATSYGTQKAIVELLLADYSRRGLLDGIALRLPTLCVRPGAPNRAASGFFSNILREPLVGLPAVLPVSDRVRHWFASPRAAVGFMRHAAVLDTADLGQRRSLTMPGLCASVAEEIEALRRVAGQGAVDLIRVEPDPAIARIVAGWPENFDPARALGFVADASFDDIIAIHIADDLAGRIGPARA